MVLQTLLRIHNLLFLCLAVFGVMMGMPHDENIPQFKVFCTIFGLIKDPDQRIRFLNEQLAPTPESLLSEIEKLAVITSKTDDLTEERQKLQKIDQNWTAEEIVREDGLKAKKFPAVDPDLPQVRLAAKKIRRIMRKAEDVIREFRGKAQEVVRLDGGARTEFKKALSGDANGKISQSSFASRGGAGASTRRQDACSYNAGGTTEGPGKSLVNDVFCLCGSAGGSSSSEYSSACGQTMTETDVRWASSTGTDNALPANPETTFPTIMGKCPNQVGWDRPNLPSAAKLRRALADFDALLGKTNFAGSNPDRKAYHFGGGHGSTDGSCDGKTGDHQKVCVNYLKVMAGNGPGISWKAAIEKAAGELEESERLSVEMNNTKTQLELLAESAWGIYEGALTGYSEQSAPHPKESKSN
ncbi:Variant surface glycoprotein, partial [Trypanosoma congolense IL3000]